MSIEGLGNTSHLDKAFESVLQKLDRSLKTQEKKKNPIDFLKMKKNWEEKLSEIQKTDPALAKQIEKKFNVTIRLKQLEKKVHEQLEALLTDSNTNTELVKDLKKAWEVNLSNPIAQEVEQTFHLRDRLAQVENKIRLKNKT